MPSRLRRFAALVLLLSACDVGANSTHGSSAVAVVGNESRGVWTSGREWHVVEEVRIGSSDGAGPDAFADVIDVTLDPLGRVWVADAQRYQIQVFDASGTHLRSIGRKGAGPGEFGNISGMAWSPDGRLWVLDGGNSRFAVYDTAGNLLSTRSRSSIITTSPWPGRFDRQGMLYDLDARPRPNGAIIPLIVRSDSTGQHRDTLVLPEYHPEVFSITQGDERNQRTTQVGVPFTGRQAWTIDPQGFVWIANTAQYRIERHGFDGTVERVIKRNPAPVVVTRAERDQMLENYRHYTERGIKIDLARIPDHHPPLTSFLFDDSGNLWVNLASRPGEGRMLDVFDPEGRYLGRVRLPVPQRTALRAIRGNRMALVTRDSLDVPTVVVMRLQKPDH